MASKKLPVSKKMFFTGLTTVTAITLLLIVAPFWPILIELLGAFTIFTLLYLSIITIYSYYLRKKIKRRRVYDVGVIFGATEVRVAGGATSHMLGVIDSLKAIGAKRILVIFTTSEDKIIKDVVESVKKKGADVKFINISTKLFTFRIFEEIRELSEAMALAERFLLRYTIPSAFRAAFTIKIYFAKVASCSYIIFEMRRMCVSSRNFAIVPLISKITIAIRNCFPVIAEAHLPCLLFDEIFVESETSKEIVLKDSLFCKLFKNKVKGAYAPPKSYEPKGKERGETFTVCFSGTFMGHHGADELVLLLKKIKEKGLPVKLRIYAPEINLYKLFEEATKRLGLEEYYERVYIKDWNEYMKDMDENCDAFVVPYSDLVKIDPFFGTPSKLTEFILLKRPIIIWNEKEYVRTLEATAKTDCAIFVKDHEEAVEAIEKLLKDKKECNVEMKESIFIKYLKEALQKRGKCTNKPLLLIPIALASINEYGLAFWGWVTYLLLLYNIYYLFRVIYLIYARGAYLEEYERRFWRKVLSN